MNETTFMINTESIIKHNKKIPDRSQPKKKVTNNPSVMLNLTKIYIHWGTGNTLAGAIVGTKTTEYICLIILYCIMLNVYYYYYYYY